MSMALFARQYVENRNPQDAVDFVNQVVALLSAEGIDAGLSPVRNELAIDGGASNTAYPSSSTLDAGGA